VDDYDAAKGDGLIDKSRAHDRIAPGRASSGQERKDEMTSSRIMRTAGYVMSGLVVAFMVLDGGMKLVPFDVVIKATAELGYPPSPGLMRGLGVAALICTALYAWPRTAVLGAILLTAYMGGTVATHLRIGNPLFTHMLFGVYLAVLAWGGLYLRDARVRALLPLRSPASEA
jgi:hypothetical protein